jgi:hypothetical protein
MWWLVRFVLLFSCLSAVSSAQADVVTQLILNRRSAVTVSPVRLYDDSTYAKATNTTFTEGELFEVLEETQNEYFDNTQNQTFKWYKVKTLSGQVGWLFGDNLAVVLPDHKVDFALRTFNKKSAQFDNGFEKSMLWVAATEGHDDFYKDRPEMNPPYKEFYLIITNERGKCVMLNYANINESGKKDIQSIYLKDLNANNIDEILLETTTQTVGGSLTERHFEVYGFRTGTLAKLFEERLTLTWESDVPSPAFSKYIEVEDKTIRVAYIDYVPCERFSLNMPHDLRTKTQERCLEYVTYSFVWDKTTKAFKPLYKESRTPISAICPKAQDLRATPSVTGKVIGTTEPADRLQVIKHYETFVKTKAGEKKVENWLYVKHPTGIYGYVKADCLQFRNTEHAEILKAYYQNPPLLKRDWSSDLVFLKVKNTKHSTLSTKH